MSRSRIYQPTPLQVSQQLTLDEAASHHLARVLRITLGEQIILFNGDGNEYGATITQINKKSVVVEINTIIERDVEAPIDIYLAQGIARGEKMDFIVQKAVELGVKKIFPLVTERCNVRLTQEREEKRLRHWQSVVISACEQSGRNRVPDIFPAQSLETLLTTVQADLKLVLSPESTYKIPATLNTPHHSILLLIGPEGGLSAEEILRAEKQQYLSVKLGSRVLRTETATLAAITAILCRFGDF